MRGLQSALCAVLSLAPSALAAAATKCNKDACFDVVKEGRKPGGEGGCAGFLEETVVPRPVTRTVLATSTSTSTSVLTSTTQPATFVTITSTFSSTTTATVLTTTLTTTSTINPVKKRSVEARADSTVPAYARVQCKNTVRYRSACLCAGAEVKTTTAKASTSIKTWTIVQSASTVTTSIITSPSSVPTTVSTTLFSTLSTTATETRTLACVLPTQVVLNPSFEGNDPFKNWARVNTFVAYYPPDGVEGTQTVAFRGLNGSNQFDDGGVKQQLVNPIPAGQTGSYTISFYVGEDLMNEPNRYYFSVSLGGETPFPKQYVCPNDQFACDVDSEELALIYRKVSKDGTFESSGQTLPLEFIFYSGTTKTDRPARADVIFVTLSTPDTCS